jgi:uncharacterized membrane protein (UPF0127 family)
MIKRSSCLLAAAVLICVASPVLPENAGGLAAMRCGKADLLVEIAADEPSRERGLMQRDAVPDGTGMLFVYPESTICTLWMKDTCVPLSAAFISKDGKITEIVQMEKIGSRKIYRSSEKVRYALEVPLGWFERNEVKAGDLCEMPPVDRP